MAEQYMQVSLPASAIGKMIDDFMRAPHVDAPEDAPAIERLKCAFHDSRWTAGERELMLTQLSNRAAEYICTILAFELSPEYQKPTGDLAKLDAEMHDETSGISFRDMIRDSVCDTLKGVLEHE